MPGSFGAKVERMRTGIAQRDGRADGPGVEHLRSEMSQLLGLFILMAGTTRASGHLARIGAEHARHIGPDLDFVGIERRAEQGRAVVGAAAAERGRASRPARRR